MDTQHFATLLAKFESLVERLERVERAHGITQAPVAAAQPKPTATPTPASGSAQLNTLLKDFDNEVAS